MHYHHVKALLMIVVCCVLLRGGAHAASIRVRIGCVTTPLSWSDATTWDGGVVPTAGDDVILDDNCGVSGTINIGSGAFTVNSLALGDILLVGAGISSTTINVNNGVQNSPLQGPQTGVQPPKSGLKLLTLNVYGQSTFNTSTFYIFDTMTFNHYGNMLIQPQYSAAELLIPPTGTTTFNNLAGATMTFYSPDGLQGINIGFSLGQIPLSSTFNNNGNMTVNMMSSSNGVNMYMSLVTDAASQISIESGNLNVRQYSSAEYTTKPVASLYGGVYVASDASLGFFIATANYYGGSLTGTGSIQVQGLFKASQETVFNIKANLAFPGTLFTKERVTIATNGYSVQLGNLTAYAGYFSGSNNNITVTNSFDMPYGSTTDQGGPELPSYAGVRHIFDNVNVVLISGAVGSISKSFNGNFNFLNRANLYILAGANFTMTDGRFNCIIQNSYGDYVAQSSSTVYVYGQLLMAHALTLYSVEIFCPVNNYGTVRTISAAEGGSPKTNAFNNGGISTGVWDLGYLGSDGNVASDYAIALLLGGPWTFLDGTVFTGSAQNPSGRLEFYGYSYSNQPVTTPSQIANCTASFLTTKPLVIPSAFVTYNAYINSAGAGVVFSDLIWGGGSIQGSSAINVTNGIIQKENTYSQTLNKNTLLVTQSVQIIYSALGASNGGSIVLAPGATMKLGDSTIAQPIDIYIPSGATLTFTSLAPYNSVGPANFVIGGAVNFMGSTEVAPVRVTMSNHVAATEIGSFRLLNTAEITFRVFSATSFDSLAVSDIANCSYAGKLTVSLADATYTPSSGATYEVLSSSSRCDRCTGSFNTVNFQQFPSNIAGGVSYDQTSTASGNVAALAVACGSSNTTCTTATRLPLYITGACGPTTTSTTSSSTSTPSSTTTPSSTSTPSSTTSPSPTTQASSTTEPSSMGTSIQVNAILLACVCASFFVLFF